MKTLCVIFAVLMCLAVVQAYYIGGHHYGKRYGYGSLYGRMGMGMYGHYGMGRMHGMYGHYGMGRMHGMYGYPYGMHGMYGYPYGMHGMSGMYGRYGYPYGMMGRYYPGKKDY